MKRILSCLIIAVLAALISAVSAFADLSLISQGEDCMKAEPPKYEEAAQLFRRAGLQGDGEGYYRLAKMYEEGLLVVGNPCTDDIAALGKQKAVEYYKLAAEEGYMDNAAPGWQSISQDKAKEMIKNHGYEKFLFGSDFPMWDFKGELNTIDQLGLSDKEKEAVLYGNAKKLLESL